MMEFTRDELARLMAVLKCDLDEDRIRSFHNCQIDFLTPISKLHEYLAKAFFEGDKILHIGIKD